MEIPKSCLSVCLSVRLPVCPYPEKRNHHSFVNISPTVVNDASMEKSLRVAQHGNPQNLISFKNAYLSVSAVILFNLLLTYAVHIDWCYYVIHKHSCRSQHISVLTTCTFTFRRVCTIEPSFLKTTSAMHRRLFKGRHLVTTHCIYFIYIYINICFIHIHYICFIHIHHICFIYIVYLKCT